MLQHPNFLDKLRVKYNPHYLYPGQYCRPVADITVGILHESPEGKSMVWKPVDYRLIKKTSLLKYVNYARYLPLDRDVDRYSSVMEAVEPISDFQIHTGDTLLVSYADRKFIYPTPDPAVYSKSALQ